VKAAYVKFVDLIQKISFNYFFMLSTSKAASFVYEMGSGNLHKMIDDEVDQKPSRNVFG
jgi:hypothetical protein